MMDTRPIDLKHKASYGIENVYSYLSEPLPQYLERTLKWSDGCDGAQNRLKDEEKRDYSKEGVFRILDTFLSDSVNESFLQQIFSRSIRMFEAMNRRPNKVEILAQEVSIYPCTILLVNPYCHYALARHEGINANNANNTNKSNITTESITTEERASRGLRHILKGIYDATNYDYDSTSIDKLSFEDLHSRIKQTKESVGLDLKFYDKTPSGPMFFFKDLLVYGRFCADRTSTKRSWQRIVDNPLQNDDLYDQFNTEYQYILINSNQALIKEQESSIISSTSKHKYLTLSCEVI